MNVETFLVGFNERDVWKNIRKIILANIFSSLYTNKLIYVPTYYFVLTHLQLESHVGDI